VSSELLSDSFAQKNGSALRVAQVGVASSIKKKK